MKRIIFSILFLLMVQGCAATTAHTETSNLEFHVFKKNGQLYVHKVVQRVYERNGSAIPVELRCFYGTDRGDLIPGPCADNVQLPLGEGGIKDMPK